MDFPLPESLNRVDESLLSSSPKVDKQQDYILAAIDVGTNSFHLVVVNIQPHLPSFKIITQEKDMVRLGDRDKSTKKLTVDAMARGLDALRRYRDLAQSLKADAIIAVATSAVREAPNGKEFLQMVQEKLGIGIDLISGEEEARRIYLGVLSAVEFNQKPHIIIDIGGGSTELILGDGHDPRVLSSTKVGAVRLTSEFVSTDPISDQEFMTLKAYVRGMLERTIDKLQAHVNPGEQPQLIGTSGTIEAIASLHAYRLSDTPPQTLSGYKISRKDVEKVLTHLRQLDLKRRLDLPGLSEQRAEIIVAGVAILHEAMVMLGCQSLTVCERSLREGVIVNWMVTHGLIADRLRYQESVRKRSVRHLAHKFHIDNEHEERVATLALSLFDQTYGTLHHWSNAERELLWAAGCLHNSGHFVHHSSHHKHSYYLIRNGGLLGYTEIEIELIANIARYHRKSAPKKKHDPYRNLPSDRHRQVVDELSAMLRIAVALDRRQIGAIKAIHCHHDAAAKTLDLVLHAAFPGDGCDLEMWSLNEKKTCFETAFGVKVVPHLETTSLL